MGWKIFRVLSLFRCLSLAFERRYLRLRYTNYYRVFPSISAFPVSLILHNLANIIDTEQTGMPLKKHDWRKKECGRKCRGLRYSFRNYWRKLGKTLSLQAWYLVTGPRLEKGNYQVFAWAKFECCLLPIKPRLSKEVVCLFTRSDWIWRPLILLFSEQKMIFPLALMPRLTMTGAIPPIGNIP
jgi:hypothetical protein